MSNKIVLFGSVLGIVLSFLIAGVATIIGVVIIVSAVYDSISKRRMV